MSASESMAEGLYESLHTSRLERAVRQHLDLKPEYRAVPEDEVPEVLARHVRDVVNRRLLDISAERRLNFTNDILRSWGSEEDVLVRLDHLISLYDATSLTTQVARRPITPLSLTKLLTNAPGEPGIGQELARELESADSVDLLCAFIRFPGVRIIKDELERLRERGVPIRVITTTYTGTTQRSALDMLVRELGAQVKVSYDTSSTRLHAKAWLIKRHSGYDTGFVGSSNLTQTALLDGVEWNIRISAVATPDLVRKFEATFETYWNEPGFETYDPDRDAARFDAAVNRASTWGPGLRFDGVDITPLPHQVAALEALAADREVHGQHRNLVVAATGTGKTMLAALDYRRLAEQQGRQPSLMFLAHRKEILEQAMRTYRNVLADGAFGELLVDGAMPTRWRHVFASVQSMANRLDDLAADTFEVMVIDEFHHASAATYKRILEHFTPWETLGLTATPERTDGIDVRDIFTGGSSYELRLWDALEQDLLCPFHYFGIADNTDLTGISWSGGRYSIEALDSLYTGDDARARLVLQALADHLGDVQEMKAMGFCVSVRHAEYMAEVFNRAGISATAVTGETSSHERDSRLRRWREGEIKIIFSVDVFNEGVDVPELDTILMLRPTESATLFQQQLGRGLRKAPDKAVLTVLDFIGQHRREFTFSDRFAVLGGVTGRELEKQVADGFPFLPSGSRIVLDRVSQDIVLSNIKSSVRRSRTDLVRDLQRVGDVGLQQFLAATGREAVDIYRGGKSWTGLRADAGFTRRLDEAEQHVAKRLGKFLIVDDASRANAYRVLADPAGPRAAELDLTHQRYGQMLLSLLWAGDWRAMSTLDEGLSRLRALPRMAEELRTVLDVSLGATRHLAQPMSGTLSDLPLRTHATYHREEILTGLGWATLGGRSPHGHSTGVLWAADEGVDALLVTLRKSEGDFSAHTMYRDYPISLNRFHWESQHNTDETSPTGQRYIHHAERGSSVVLFTRVHRVGELGSEPYVCLGPATYAEHRGSRPMGITWQLDRPMPGDIFAAGAVVA
ncbi:DUF3427 domain-containing protein [Microlunatus sp. Y2014]|uniref:DUF3427 domain-containing protein n=1 Tax=Microlunatus sp. Y2014 TaxID=3418488 RepID=UPI003DA714E5